jgi:DNA repair protein RadA/Sms
MVSSLSDNEIENNIAFTGEVGLGGEIRPVSRVENRISEAEKLGFEAIYVSKYNMKGIDKTNFKIRIHEFSKLDELFRRIF